MVGNVRGVYFTFAFLHSCMGEVRWSGVECMSLMYCLENIKGEKEGRKRGERWEEDGLLFP